MKTDKYRDAARLATIIKMLCTKRSPRKSMDFTCDGIVMNSQHIAVYAEQVQQMDSALLEAAYRGAIEAIEIYVHGGDKL
jgi:hypothetical protein